MTSSFSPQISGLLDQFVIPDLPEDFTDSVVAAAVGQASAEASPTWSQPWTRARSGNGNSPWKRTRLYASGIAGMAMLSTAAAAALSLADIPYRIPVVSDLVEKVIPRAEPVQVVENSRSAPDPVPTEMTEIGQGDDQTGELTRPKWRDMNRDEKIAVVKQRIAQNEERVQQRRAARGLPPLSDTQLRNRRIMIRKAIRSGAISRPAVRRALRRAAFVREGQRTDVQRSETPAASDVAAPAAIGTMPVSIPQETGRQAAAELDVVSDPASIPIAPEQSDEAVTDPTSAVPQTSVPGTEAETTGQEDMQSDDASVPVPAAADIRDKLPPALQERLRNATPAERRRILREIRSRRLNGQSLRDIRQRLRDMRRTGK